jgi:hypothetical protein
MATSATVTSHVITDHQTIHMVAVDVYLQTKFYSVYIYRLDDSPEVRSGMIPPMEEVGLTVGTRTFTGGTKILTPAEYPPIVETLAVLVAVAHISAAPKE